MSYDIILMSYDIKVTEPLGINTYRYSLMANQLNQRRSVPIDPENQMTPATLVNFAQEGARSFMTRVVYLLHYESFPNIVR